MVYTMDTLWYYCASYIQCKYNVGLLSWSQPKAHPQTMHINKNLINAAPGARPTHHVAHLYRILYVQRGSDLGR